MSKSVHNPYGIYHGISQWGRSIICMYCGPRILKKCPYPRLLFQYCTTGRAALRIWSRFVVLYSRRWRGSRTRVVVWGGRRLERTVRESIHYSNVIMSTTTSQSPALRLCTQPFIAEENIKAPHHWSYVRGIHRSPVNSPHKGPVTRKMFQFDDVIMEWTMPNKGFMSEIYIYILLVNWWAHRQTDDGWMADRQMFR